MSRKLSGLAAPPALVRQVEAIARQERKSNSGLLREMVRVYQGYREHRDDMRWVERILQKAKAEQLAAPVSVEGELRLSEGLAGAGGRRARAQGVGTSIASVTRLVHKSRKRRRTA